MTARVPRLATFGLAAAIPLGGWAYLGGPLFLAGLALMLAAGLLVIPALVVTAVCFAPDVPKLAVPRRWRAAYRNRTDRNGWKIRPRRAQHSSYITTRLRQMTWAADRYRCVACKSKLDIQVDHRVPWAWGGLTIAWNCFTLCSACNLLKLDYWEQHGRPRYSRRFDTGNIYAASRIFRREGWARWSPLRLLRMAWALGR